MTEELLTGTLNLNTNKTKYLGSVKQSHRSAFAIMQLICKKQVFTWLAQKL